MDGHLPLTHTYNQKLLQTAAGLLTTSDLNNKRCERNWTHIWQIQTTCNVVCFYVFDVKTVSWLMFPHSVLELNPLQAAVEHSRAAPGFQQMKYAALWHRRDTSNSDLMQWAAPFVLSTTVSVERSTAGRLRGETMYKCPRVVFSAIMTSISRNYEP